MTQLLAGSEWLRVQNDLFLACYTYTSTPYRSRLHVKSRAELPMGTLLPDSIKELYISCSRLPFLTFLPLQSFPPTTGDVNTMFHLLTGTSR